MLSTTIREQILSTITGTALSTSMIAKKSKLSRITVAKYLSALQAEGGVEVARIGKALAWRATEYKPLIGIVAKTGTARMVQLALGREYAYIIGTGTAAVRSCSAIITDNPRIVRSLGEERDIILVGATEENAFCIPELFETSELRSLVRKIIEEQNSPEILATACIAIEHLDEAEDLFGFQGAEELVLLTKRLLEEHSVAYTQYERTYFLVEGPIPEDVLADIEQTFHTILAHLYGEMVVPGEETTFDGVSHVVPSISMTLAAPTREQRIEQQ